MDDRQRPGRQFALEPGLRWRVFKCAEGRCGENPPAQGRTEGPTAQKTEKRVKRSEGYPFKPLMAMPWMK